LRREKTFFKVATTQASHLFSPASQLVLGKGLLHQLVMSKEIRQIAAAETAEISAALKSALAPLASKAGTSEFGTSLITNGYNRSLDFPVADLVGRCFLRVCFWIDVCTSWAKKYHPPAYTFERPKTLPTPLRSPVAAAPALDVQSTVAPATRTTT
jgi:hypothetical protein